jgi:hypothetical protein
MAKFKRRAKIATFTGEQYVTDVRVEQIDYFMVNSPHDAILNVAHVNGTGHVKVVRIKKGHIASYTSV